MKLNSERLVENYDELMVPVSGTDFEKKKKKMSTLSRARFVIIVSCRRRS